MEFVCDGGKSKGCYFMDIVNNVSGSERGSERGGDSWGDINIDSDGQGRSEVSFLSVFAT